MMDDLPHTKSDGAGDSLGAVVQKIARWTWLVVLLTVIGALGALIVSTRHSSVYQSTGQVQLDSISDASIISGSTASSTPSSSNYVQEYSLLTGTQVKKGAAQRLHLSSAPPVSFSQGATNTQLVTITADAPSPGNAANIVNAYAGAYVAASQAAAQQQLTAAISALNKVVNNETTRLNTLNGYVAKANAAAAAASNRASSNTTSETTSAASTASTSAANTASQYSAEIGVLEAQQQFYLQRLAQAQFGEVPGQANDAAVLVPGTVNGSPISPKTSRDTLLGAVIGLLIGLVAALVLAGRDDRLRDVRDVQAVLDQAGGLPVLMSIPKKRISRTASQGSDETYRALRSTISLGTAARTKRMQIVGIDDDSNHARVAAGLAAAIARTGQRTVLLCADVRVPHLPTMLGLQTAPGFTSVLTGDLTPFSVEQAVTTEENMVFVGPGSIDAASPELLARSTTPDTIKLLSESGDKLIVNAAPLSRGTDAAILATMVDWNIIVVDLGRTRAQDLSAALAMLGRAEAPLLGVVCAPRRPGLSIPEPSRPSPADVVVAAPPPLVGKTSDHGS